ncbi:hypothetical protein IFM89_008395 [Coptis chinensis]|uniref:Uncharacterized protein n=1 Tax=Coptis chinensis TaxID=261450 RepID=A0A835I926_9MAGN|nr:hypothetical protein IFM89_008395 [Coptis chinensis]
MTHQKKLPVLLMQLFIAYVENKLNSTSLIIYLILLVVLLLKPPEIQIAAAKFANEENPSTSSSSVNLQNSHFEESPMDYPSPMSNSDAGVSYGWPFMDYSALAGSGSSESDFGTFGGLDDFAQNYLAPDLGYDEEMNGGDYSQSSSLWNFYF